MNLINYTLILLCAMSLAVPLHAKELDESRDSIPDEETHITAQQFIVPGSLIAYGTLELTINHGKGIMNNALARQVVEHHPRYIEVDNYTQYVPAATPYLLNLAGIKGRHGYLDYTMILGIASIYTAISVNTLKYTVKEKRPDTTTRNSFPSGHSAVAFMGAELLWQEYKDVSPWYGIGGYVVAAGTGLLRIHNNRHWLGDVACGAGLGIACAKLAYITFSALHLNIGKHSTSSPSQSTLSFCPYYADRNYGMMMSLQF